MYEKAPTRKQRLNLDDSELENSDINRNLNTSRNTLKAAARLLRSWTRQGYSLSAGAVIKLLTREGAAWA